MELAEEFQMFLHVTSISPSWILFYLSYNIEHTCDLFLGSNREICNFWKGDWGAR